MFTVVRGKCAQRDYDVHQRMNANGLLPYDLFSSNKAKQDGKIFEYGVMEHYYCLHTKLIKIKKRKKWELAKV